MKKQIAAALACAAMLAPALHAQEPPALDAMRETYAQFQDTLRAKYAGQQAALDAALPPRLDALEQACMQRGDLDGVLAARGAREPLDAAIKEKTTFEIPDDPATAELRQVFNEHREARAAIAEKEREENRTLTARYADSLEKLKRRLVTEDKIDGALEVQKEIEGLNLEPARPAAQPAAPQPAAPQPQPQPAAPAKPAAETNRLVPAADLARNIQDYAGKPVRFLGRLVSLERDNDKRVFLTFDGGIRIRHDMPNVAASYNTSRVRYDNFGLNRAYVFSTGNTYVVETTLTMTPSVGNHTTYRNAVIRGCNDAVARNYLKVACQAPCPEAVRQGPNPCPHCK